MPLTNSDIPLENVQSGKEPNNFRSDGFSPNGVQAVLFDLDGTLRHNNPPAVHVFLRHAIELGVTDDPLMRREFERWVHYYWAQSPDLLGDLQALGDEDLFWTNYARRSLEVYGCTPEQAEALAPQLQSYMEDTYNPEDCVLGEVPPTLEALKQQGFRLAVLSNRTKPYTEQLRSLGLAKYFEFALAAGEVEAWKPDPMVFRHALQHMNIFPEQVIYVGDNYYADVIGARQAGLRPVLLDPQGLFPEAGCPVIQSLSELCGLLKEQHPNR